MKTDFEFIKDKFDESEVRAPESMNEKFVLDKIKDVEPKKNRKPLAAGLSFAAAVALFTAVALVVTNVFGNTPNPAVIQGSNATLANFKSTDDVKKALRKINKQRKSSSGYGLDGIVTEDYAAGEITYKSNTLSSAATGKSTADTGHNSTYTQYTNVDEADVVKTDGKYIYYLDNNTSATITVFSTEGKNSKKLAAISPKNTTKSKVASRAFKDFYIYNNKLIATVRNYNSYYTYDTYNTNYSNRNTEKTSVEIYDISDVNNIRLTDSFYQSGNYCSSRMIGSMMYVVSTQYAYNENDLPRAGKLKSTTSTDDEATPDEIPYDDIYTVDDPSEPNFLVVSSIDTDKSAQAVKTKAILGSADTVYCNTEHLFVTAVKYDYGKNVVGKVVDYVTGSNTQSTQIVKVDLNNNLDFTATAKVKGYVDNQYAMDEKDGCLRVATTYQKRNKDVNTMYILDGNLNQVGRTKDFAKGESIKAVRYIGDTAYVITYEQTDPLFVIDTKDARNPKILGEVKISGFSTMLVPVDENTLLGIGYYTQDEDYIDIEVEEGIKLALFDVTDKTNPKVLDEKVFKNFESDVQDNPKALLVNNERNDYTIPYSSYDDLDEQGVINFKVENNKIKIVDKYVSEKFTDSDDYNATLDRCVYSGDYIYMVGTYWMVYDDYEKVTPVIDAVKYK